MWESQSRYLHPHRNPYLCTFFFWFVGFCFSGLFLSDKSVNPAMLPFAPIKKGDSGGFDYNRASRPASVKLFSI